MYDIDSLKDLVKCEVNLSRWLNLKDKCGSNIPHYKSEYTQEAYYDNSKNDIDLKKDDKFIKSLISNINEYDDIPDDILKLTQYNDHID